MSCAYWFGISDFRYHRLGTGWVLAGLVTTFGYGLLGLWLVGLNYSALHWFAFPRRLAQYGVITGWIMMLGILAVPGIVTRVDMVETTGWSILIALYLGGLGWNILYTIWCIEFGRLLLTNR